MTFSEIKKMVVAEYDRRQLASNVRYRALDDFESMLRILYPEILDEVSNFPDRKEIMKDAYEKFRRKQGLKMSSGASSMINEVYNQLERASIRLTHY